MKSLAVITRRPIAVLWGGLVFSAIGDELYSVALIWFATGLLGSQAGYVPALQAATILLFSLAGGLWTDRHDPRRVMIAADVVRSLAMLVIPLLSLVAPVSIRPGAAGEPAAPRRRSPAFAGDQRPVRCDPAPGPHPRAWAGRRAAHGRAGRAFLHRQRADLRGLGAGHRLAAA
ncbi:MAG: MFS transporter [Proteobacteria bacterium]|nr:MFS transporter [Pseudomonadota bacterium]